MEAVKIKDFDHGDVPAAVQHQRNLEKGLTNSQTRIQTVSSRESARVLDAVTLVFKLQKSPGAKGVMTCRVHLPVQSVSIQPLCITLMHASDFSLELDGMGDLVVEHKGREYPVTFVGGSFAFTEMGQTGISFMRKPDAPEQ